MYINLFMICIRTKLKSSMKLSTYFFLNSRKVRSLKLLLLRLLLRIILPVFVKLSAQSQSLERMRPIIPHSFPVYLIEAINKFRLCDSLLWNFGSYSHLYKQNYHYALLSVVSHRESRKLTAQKQTIHTPHTNTHNRFTVRDPHHTCR